ncbi:hypothetical protein [Congzhengia minquanensis]|uniref:Uncharacterized protein n=1 Tax=Congzhengia minquanensis TaxID=2763657 RepID=A0A926HYB2_9FIRM|nr:hypothetical protein [Congzhengia minquanensis]MBC8540919.1 hypothetical protein [Congzhengia minquanensis]
MSTMNIEKNIKDFKELQRMSEEIAAEMEAIKDKIKAEMSERGTDEIITGEYKIRYKTVKSSRFDTKAFKEAHKDLYSAFVKDNITTRFTIA